MATKRSASRVGAHFDPAVAFDRALPYPWSRGAEWLQALPNDWSYLLICALVERFSLPMFIKRLPRSKVEAQTIRQAIEMGRQMAIRSVDRQERDQMEAILDATLNRESDDIARYSVYAARYCISLVPDPSPVADTYIQYSFRTLFKMLPSQVATAKENEEMRKVNDVGREFLRLAFQQAEQYAYEEGYPALTGKEADIVLATICRNNMINLMKRVREVGISDLLDAKLSSADEKMRSLDYASVYLTNRGVKPSMWKKSTMDAEDRAAMAAFQVLLNDSKTNHPGLIVRELNTIPRAEVFRPKKKDKISGFIDVEALIGDFDLPYARLGSAFQWLPVNQQRLFLADCAEHVLPTIEPSESQAIELSKRAIKAARAYANGKGSEEAMFDAGEALFSVVRQLEREAREVFFDTLGDIERQAFLYKSEWPYESVPDPRLSYWAALSAADTIRHNDQLFLMDAAKSASSAGDDEKEYEWQKQLLLKYLRTAYDNAMREINSLPELEGDDLSVLKATLLRAEALQNLKRLSNAKVINQLQAEIQETTNSQHWMPKGEYTPRRTLLDFLISNRKKTKSHLRSELDKQYARLFGSRRGSVGEMVMVGARTKTADNMQVDPKKLENLAKRDRLAALRHPQATKEQLTRWLAVHPQTGGVPKDHKERLAALEQNPTLPLFWFENPPTPADPLMWAIWAIRFAIAKEEFNNAIATLPAKQVVSWAEKEIRENIHHLGSKHSESAREMTEMMNKILTSAEFRKYLEAKGESLLPEYQRNVYPKEGRDLMMAILIFEDAYSHLLASENAEYPAAKLRVAKDRAMTSLDYAYYAKFYRDEGVDRYKIAGWEDRRFYTQYMQAQLAGLRSFLATGSAQIGARMKTADNPESTPVKLENLAKRDKLAALRHPNATKEQLLRWLNINVEKGLLNRLAALEQNPVLELFFLETADSYDPLLIAIWKTRYLKAKLEFQALSPKLTINHWLDWCEQEIYVNLEELKHTSPEEEAYFTRVIKSTMFDRPAKAITLERGVRDLQALGSRSRRVNWIKNSIISWFDAMRLMPVNVPRAYSYAESSINFSYFTKFADEAPTAGSWPECRNKALEMQAKVKAAKAILAGDKTPKVGGLPSQYKRDQVAARVKMADNAELSQEKLENLAKRDRLAALRHPQATRQQLARWLGVNTRSTSLPKNIKERIEALETNPVLPLLLMEDPPSHDPLLVAIWYSRYELANKELKEALKPVTLSKIMEWAQYEIRSVLLEIENVFPGAQAELTGVFKSTDLDKSLALLEKWKNKDQPYNYVGWALSYWVDALERWRRNIETAKDYAETAASYVYTFRYYQKNEIGSWQSYHIYTQQLEAELKGLRAFLSGSVSGLSRVGRKQTKAIVVIGAKEKPRWNDPKANPDLLAKQARKVPKTYTNPNLPLSVLMEGAIKFPWYVEQNPVLGMLSLEDPGQLASLLDVINSAWRDRGVQALDEKNQWLYISDCAEHVLPIFEKKYPADPRLRTAIEIARRIARGQATRSDLVDASSSSDYWHTGKKKTAAYFAASVLDEMIHQSVFEGADQAVNAVIRDATDQAKPWKESSQKEKQWQANRVRYYYAQEHPEYQPPEGVGALPSLVVQCVLVTKKTAPTLAAAKTLVERLRFSTAFVTESRELWRFQQQSPSLFVKDSFVTRPLATGVKAIMAAHKPELTRRLQAPRTKK